MELIPVAQIPKDKWMLGFLENGDCLSAIKLSTEYEPHRLIDRDSYEVHDEIRYFVDILDKFSIPRKKISYTDAMKEIVLKDSTVIWEKEEYIGYGNRDLKIFVEKFNIEDKFYIKEKRK